MDKDIIKSITDTITATVKEGNDKLTEAIKKIPTLLSSVDSGISTDWIPYLEGGTTIKGEYFSEEFLQSLANNYDVDLLSAPLVIGHTDDRDWEASKDGIVTGKQHHSY